MEDASPSWMSFIIRLSYGEIAFQGVVNLKTCREIEIKTKRLDHMLVIRKKEEPKKGQKSAPVGKIGTYLIVTIICEYKILRFWDSDDFAGFNFCDFTKPS